jgi:hypothetical protein
MARQFCQSLSVLGELGEVDSFSMGAVSVPVNLWLGSAEGIY